LQITKKHCEDVEQGQFATRFRQSDGNRRVGLQTVDAHIHRCDDDLFHRHIDYCLGEPLGYFEDGQQSRGTRERERSIGRIGFFFGKFECSLGAIGRL
jgi:hypothetical protein